VQKRLSAKSFRATDLRGLAKLGIQGVVGVTNLVEAVHLAVSSRAGVFGAVPRGRTTGLTGLIYGAVRGVSRATGGALDRALGAVPPGPAASTPAREAWIAALNGVVGDQLAESGNPLAIAMALRVDGQPVNLDAHEPFKRLPRPTGRIAVLVHGLAMNDLQWSRRGHDHGKGLADAHGFTPLYLHYNTGLHIWQNGRAFASVLEKMVMRWPVPVSELVIIGHSMGGLVARSACHLAASPNRSNWLKVLSKLVCLGSPHHGAPLERGGRLIDSALRVSPYLAPFARIGRIRSAGITDLRYGNLQDGNVQDGTAQTGDDRTATALPEGAQTYLVAATTSTTVRGLRSSTIGDGLVPVASALGQHRKKALCLRVPEDHQLVITAANHWDLLSRPEVFAQLCKWLG
jgi:pimeloyl-ACP methyl ester carboxylesterase